MSGEPVISFTGHVGRDPERSEKIPDAVNFSVAVTPRKKDQQTGDWQDQETQWYDCTAWGSLGNGVLDAVKRGELVTVQGAFRQAQAWQSDDGEKSGVRLRVTVREIGVTVKKNTGGASQADGWATAGSNDQTPF